MTWQDILKIRPRKRKRQINPPNIFAGETNEENPRRIMGRGVMRDLRTGEEVESIKENTPKAKHHARKIKQRQGNIREANTRAGIGGAEPGDFTGFSKNPRIGAKKARKATKTFPRNRCARCGRMLSARKRNDIRVKDKDLRLSFCDECAADMVKE